MSDLRVDRAALEADWRKRGFSCDLWIDPPGQVWEDNVREGGGVEGV
jgi:hypothetical protein